jgi:hypothetical protein
MDIPEYDDEAFRDLYADLRKAVRLLWDWYEDEVESSLSFFENQAEDLERAKETGAVHSLQSDLTTAIETTHRLWSTLCSAVRMERTLGTQIEPRVASLEKPLTLRDLAKKARETIQHVRQHPPATAGEAFLRTLEVQCVLMVLMGRLSLLEP